MKRTLLFIFAAMSFVACKRKECYKCYNVTYQNWQEVGREYVDEFCRDKPEPGTIYGANGFNTLGVEDGEVYQCFRK